MIPGHEFVESSSKSANAAKKDHVKIGDCLIPEQIVVWIAGSATGDTDVRNTCLRLPEQCQRSLAEYMKHLSLNHKVPSDLPLERRFWSSLRMFCLLYRAQTSIGRCGCLAALARLAWYGRLRQVEEPEACRDGYRLRLELAKKTVMLSLNPPDDVVKIVKTDCLPWLRRLHQATATQCRTRAFR
jgi:hypothetical protein